MARYHLSHAESSTGGEVVLHPSRISPPPALPPSLCLQETQGELLRRHGTTRSQPRGGFPGTRQKVLAGDCGNNSQADGPGAEGPSSSRVPASRPKTREYDASLRITPDQTDRLRTGRPAEGPKSQYTHRQRPLLLKRVTFRTVLEEGRPGVTHLRAILLRVGLTAMAK